MHLSSSWGILFERRYGETETFFLNEVGFGYTFRLPFGLLIELTDDHKRSQQRVFSQAIIRN